jgi:hypothetical protein
MTSRIRIRINLMRIRNTDENTSKKKNLANDLKLTTTLKDSYGQVPITLSLCTWKSFCGFQSLSKMMTVSAVARARVDSRKRKEPGALK